jgi:hypothetical protein
MFFMRVGPSVCFVSETADRISIKFGIRGFS